MGSAATGFLLVPPRPLEGQHWVGGLVGGQSVPTGSAHIAGGWCWLSSGSLPEAVNYNTSVLLTLVTLCGLDSSKNMSWVREGLFQLMEKEAADPYGPTSEAPWGHPPDSTNQSKS